MGRLAGRLAPGLEVGEGIARFVELQNDPNLTPEQRDREIAKVFTGTTASLVCGAGGTMVGATIGSFLGPAGTIIGGLIGGAVASATCKAGGESLVDHLPSGGAGDLPRFASH